jgi:NAD(P)-dependent dehydrogenase (short-subunit alcohol dehydrogenase family)
LFTIPFSGEETVHHIQQKRGRSHFTVVDVSNEQEVREWIDQVVTIADGIDVLVNNAASFIFGTIEEVTNEMWDKILAVNIKVCDCDCNCDSVIFEILFSIELYCLLYLRRERERMSV